jgi:hypothetical protein
MKKLILPFLFAFFFVFSTNAKGLYIGLGTNWFIPLSSGPVATMHPINYNTLPIINASVLQLGGVQLSALYTQKRNEKTELHYKLSIARNSRWQGSEAKSIDAQSLGTIIYSVNNYAVNISTTLQYKLISNIYLDIGAGVSTSIYNGMSVIAIDVFNKNYSRLNGKIDGTRINPFMPIAISWQRKKTNFGLYYNQAILATHANYGGVSKGVNYGVLQLEIMRKLN